jgi:DNA-binding transcriptional MerR regulator
MNDFNIQAASLISGVTVHQIRAWERRYNAVRPSRMHNNFRSYTQDDITRLNLLGILTKHGIAISKIASLDITELQKQHELLATSPKIQDEDSFSKDSKERLGILLAFLYAKKIDILKHEITKLHTLNSVIEILIPLTKQIMQQASFHSDDSAKMLVGSVIEQINSILTQASTSRGELTGI